MFLVHFNILEIAFSKENALAICPSVISRNAGDYLVQGGSPTSTTEVFSENESDGAQLVSFTAGVPGV